MQSYEQALKLFATWLEEGHEITQVEAVKDVHIRSYINDLQIRGKYTFCVDRQSERFNHPQNRRDYQDKMKAQTMPLTARMTKTPPLAAPAAARPRTMPPWQ